MVIFWRRTPTIYQMGTSYGKTMFKKEKMGALKDADCNSKQRYICERPLKENTGKGTYNSTR